MVVLNGRQMSSHIDDKPMSNRNGIVADFVILPNIVSLSKESISYRCETGDLHPYF